MEDIKSALFFGDNSEDSKEAENILRENNIPYLSVPSSGEGISPILISPDGEIYLGLMGILYYVESYMERRGQMPRGERFESV